MPSVLASSISTLPQFTVFENMVVDRFAALPVEVVMTFLLQLLQDTAIGTMATDLGVNGIGGLAQANTEQERRDVLLNAIRTRRRAGTVFALKRAIETLGYSNPIILEGVGDVPVVYDGTYIYDGYINYAGGNNGWAQFMVILPENDLVGLTQAQIDLLVQYINYHKNERSELIGVGYYGTQLPLYDGQFNYDGSAYYNGLPNETIIFVYP
jgi:hypothetical protein